MVIAVNRDPWRSFAHENLVPLTSVSGRDDLGRVNESAGPGEVVRFTQSVIWGGSTLMTRGIVSAGKSRRKAWELLGSNSLRWTRDRLPVLMAYGLFSSTVTLPLLVTVILYSW